MFLIEAPAKLALEQVGATKETIVNELSAMIDIAEKDDKVILDNN
jgi:hypothetical protein